MRGIILGWLLAAALVVSGCASPAPSGAIRTAAAPADQCEKYRGDPTTFGRCQLFTSPLGADLIPAAGRSAGLENQLHCAKFRSSLEQYQACIGVASKAAEPSVTVARAAPGADEVSGLESMFGESAAREERPRALAVARPIERPHANAAQTLEQARAVAAGIVERAEIAPKTERPVRYLPACAENGSCYGDISSHTGRPKTVHVSGYYRKDGTYVRGYYRSRPRPW